MNKRFRELDSKSIAMFTRSPAGPSCNDAKQGCQSFMLQMNIEHFKFPDKAEKIRCSTFRKNRRTWRLVIDG